MILLIAAMAIIPLTPHFSDRLVYTAFLYKVPFLLVGCSIVLGLGVLGSLPVLWWAIVREPALVISESTISVKGFKERVGNIEDVTRIVPLWPGANVNLEFKNRRPMALPVFFYEQPGATMDKLRLLVQAANAARSSQA